MSGLQGVGGNRSLIPLIDQRARASNSDRGFAATIAAFATHRGLPEIPNQGAQEDHEILFEKVEPPESRSLSRTGDPNIGVPARSNNGLFGETFDDLAWRAPTAGKPTGLYARAFNRP